MHGNDRSSAHVSPKNFTHNGLERLRMTRKINIIITINPEMQVTTWTNKRKDLLLPPFICSINVRMLFSVHIPHNTVRYLLLQKYPTRGVK